MADLSVYGKLKTLADYQNANKAQNFAVQRQLEESQLKKNALQLKQQEALSGGNLPATIQIANEIDKALRAGDMERANLLHQVHKTMDKGILPYGGQPFQYPMDNATQPGQFGTLDQNLMELGTPQTTAPPSPVVFRAQPIPGYGGAKASIEGQVAGAKEAATQRQKDIYEPRRAGEIERSKLAAKGQEEGRQSLPKIQRTLESAELRDDFLNKKMDSIADRANVFTTGFGGTLTSAIPGTPAFDLAQDVKTLLANAGFDRLQEMRDNSPTGGALGQVSERELDLLQSAAQALMTSQSRNQFLANLQAFKAQRAASLDNVRRAYMEDYQRFGGGSQIPASLYERGEQEFNQRKDQRNGVKRMKYNPATGALE